MPRKREGTLVYRATSGWNARVLMPVAQPDGTTAEQRRWVPLETHDRELARRKLGKLLDSTGRHPGNALRRR